MNTNNNLNENIFKIVSNNQTKIDLIDINLNNLILKLNEGEIATNIVKNNIKKMDISGIVDNIDNALKSDNVKLKKAFPNINIWFKNQFMSDQLFRNKYLSIKEVIKDAKSDINVNKLREAKGTNKFDKVRQDICYKTIHDNPLLWVKLREVHKGLKEIANGNINNKSPKSRT